MCVFLDRNSNHLAIDIILQVCLVLKQIDLTKHLWEYQTSEYKQESCFRLEQDSASAPRLSVRDCWCWGVWSTAVLLFILCMTVTDSDNGLHVESRPSQSVLSRTFVCISRRQLVNTPRRMFVYTWNGNLNDLCVSQLSKRYWWKVCVVYVY